jgi:hypothetical protein
VSSRGFEALAGKIVRSPGRSPGSPHNDAPLVSGGEGGVMASNTSVRAWEGAYRQYGRAWEWIRSIR